MKKTVVAALLLQDGRLLICQRSANGSFPGKWEFPGGKVEAGEDPRSALCRELREELGITAEIGEELWRVEHQYSGHASILLVFLGILSYEGVVENRIFQRICWASTKELGQYDFLEADRTLIEKLTQGEIVMPPCQPARR